MKLKKQKKIRHHSNKDNTIIDNYLISANISTRNWPKGNLSKRCAYNNKTGEQQFKLN